MHLLDGIIHDPGLATTMVDERAVLKLDRAVAQRDAQGGDETPYCPPVGRRHGDRGRLARPKGGRSRHGRSGIRPRLYTACIAYAGGPVMMQAFHASVARHPTEVVQRLRRRFGDEVVSLAEIRMGFHPASPLVIALVPAAVADAIRKVEMDCGSPDVSEFVVDIEQRIEL